MDLKKLSFRLLQFLFLLLVSFTSFSQDKYERKLSVNQWIEEMVNYSGELYILENTEIYYDYEIDTLYSWNCFAAFMKGEIEVPETHIKAEVFLNNCKFPDNTFSLNNIHFKQTVTFYDCDVSSVNIYKCQFKEGIDLRSTYFGELTFADCFFGHRIVIVDAEIASLSFSECKFQTSNKYINSRYQFGTEEEEKGYNYILRIIQPEEKINYFIISNCEISALNTIPVISITGSFEVIYFSNTDFSHTIVDFNLCSIEKIFGIVGCTFKKPLGVDGFTFPANNSSCLWSKIRRAGLGLWETDNYDATPYTARNDSELVDINQFNDLIGGYKKFYTMYKSKGDMKSANSCYVDMKNIQTRKLRYSYQENPSMNALFAWRLNQFLKYFCEYGTSPVRSLIISMYVIIVFACFYFFFYSEWDRINRSFLIAKSKKLLTYFQSEQKMEDFYTDEHKDELESYQSFKQQIHDSAGKIPFYMEYLMKPLYRLSLIRHKVIGWLYRRTEILSGKWEDLTGSRKMVVGSVVGVSLTFYLAYLVFIRSLNSLFLSINTFSTLGFGDIPVKGISRYVAILEGFLGWFLLSIFSVSLISQILQN